MMMDTQQLKLHLINKIIELEDEAILQTIAKLLNMEEATPEDGGFPPFSFETPPQNDSASDLQSDIDEIFNPF